MGYHRAGFDVVGVDIEPQPNYPFEFHQRDAIYELEGWPDSVLWKGFDAVHASPPCQAYVKGLGAVNRALGREWGHVALVDEVREHLRRIGLPYVIENVPGAPLENPVRLCGSSFNLQVRRHRLFECSFPVLVPPCDHSRQNGDFWTSFRPNGETRRSKVAQVYGQAAERERWAEAMGIDWMTYDELAEAIPPDYTATVGVFLMSHIYQTRGLENFSVPVVFGNG